MLTITEQYFNTRTTDPTAARKGNSSDAETQEINFKNYFKEDNGS